MCKGSRPNRLVIRFKPFFTPRMTSKVSFTIRRPSAPGSPFVRSTTSSPRPTRAFYDPNVNSGDEDDEDGDEAIQDELVTLFDQYVLLQS
jgi:hypothetical protein